MITELPSFYDLIRFLGMFLGRRPFLGPKIAMIDVTDNCDLHCLMCAYHSPLVQRQGLQQIHKNMDYNTFASLLADLSRMKTEFITLCGNGEPFLHPDIKKMFLLSAKYKFKTQVITNGIHIDREMVDELIEIPIYRLTFSVHAGDSLTYKAVHPLREEQLFLGLKENMIYLNQRKKTLRRKYPQVSIINVISRPNYGNLASMVEFARDAGANRIWFKPLIVTEVTAEAVSLQPAHLERIKVDLEDLLRRGVGLEHNIDEFIQTMGNYAKSAGHNHRLPGKGRCYLPWIGTNIITDGKVLGCTYQGDAFLGDITKETFRDIWNGGDYREFRNNRLCGDSCLGAAVYPCVGVINAILKKRIIKAA